MNKRKRIEIIVGIVATVGMILSGCTNAADKKSATDKKTIIDSENKSVAVGDYVEFGSYEQDNDESNGKEKIEWLVLDKQDDRILVISKYALECQPYNKDWEYTTWEDCTLREWLNEEFIDEAFSEDEADVISKVTVTADENPEYSTDPGNDTKDKVFLLSVDEVNEYFGSDSERECELTEYAIDNEAFVAYNGNCVWWLRSPGGDSCSAATVRHDGRVGGYGDIVHTRDFAVRPALWIDLNS